MADIAPMHELRLGMKVFMPSLARLLVTCVCLGR
jgi:hypothetical protein